MNASQNIAKHFREVFFGGNWTVSNLKDTLADITWQQATTQVYSLNTIVMLTYHIGYFVSVALKVLECGPLDGKDALSFNQPPVTSEEDWKKLQEKIFTDAKKFADLLGQLPEHTLWEDFTDKKYGIYYRNMHGIIEHTHYHLGQIAILKKIIQQETKK